MNKCLECFTYVYDSFILDTYIVKYKIFEIDGGNEYAIVIINSLNDKECHLKGYKSYDAAVEDVTRIHNLVQWHTIELAEDINA